MLFTGKEKLFILNNVGEELMSRDDDLRISGFEEGGWNPKLRSVLICDIDKRVVYDGKRSAQWYGITGFLGTFTMLNYVAKRTLYGAFDTNQVHGRIGKLWIFGISWLIGDVISEEITITRIGQYINQCKTPYSQYIRDKYSKLFPKSKYLRYRRFNKKSKYLSSVSDSQYNEECKKIKNQLEGKDEEEINEIYEWFTNRKKPKPVANNPHKEWYEKNRVPKHDQKLKEKVEKMYTPTDEDVLREQLEDLKKRLDDLERKEKGIDNNPQKNINKDNDKI